MADARFLTARVELVDKTTGVWCDTCALPSALTFTLCTQIGEHFTLRTWTVCEDCGVRT